VAVEASQFQYATNRLLIHNPLQPWSYQFPSSPPNSTPRLRKLQRQPQPRNLNTLLLPLLNSPPLPLPLRRRRNPTPQLAKKLHSLFRIQPQIIPQITRIRHPPIRKQTQRTDMRVQVLHMPLRQRVRGIREARPYAGDEGGWPGGEFGV